MPKFLHLALAFCCAALPLCAHDWLIVPGERVGPVTATATEAGLRAAFGTAAVTRATIQIDKKTTAPGLEIYHGRPGESLAVLFPRQQKDGLWWPLLVIPCYGSPGADCRWRTASGVRPGANVADLEKMNGKPFRLFPSSVLQVWTDPRWDDGRLAAEMGEDVELYFEGPEDRFYSGPTYVGTNAEPLHAGVRRLDRMHVFLLSQARQAPPNDWTVYGRVWSMLAEGAVVQLRETFGAAQVHRAISQAEEGLGDLPAVAIFDGQPGARVLRTLDENAEIVICESDGPCRWHIAGGIPRVMTLTEAQKRNGHPFVFNGFAWDLGGIVTSWEGGRMPALLAHARVYVDCEDGYPENMMGDGVNLRSDDPRFAKLKCTVRIASF